MDIFEDFFISQEPEPAKESTDQNSGLVDSKKIADFRNSLLNKDPKIQLEALEGVINLLKSDDEHVSQWRDELIESNFVETLAETITSFNTDVVCISLTLLEDLIQSKVFVANRAIVIIKSVLSSVLLFSEYSEDGSVVKMGLDLVSKIIINLVEEGKEFKHFCDLEEVVNVGLTILKSPNEDLSILQSVSQIVYTVLLSSKALLDEESEKEVSFPRLVAELLNQLCRATHTSPDMDIDTAICEVGAACMRLFVRAPGSNKEVLEPLHRLIRTAMTNLIVPHINDWLPQIDQNNMGEVLALLKGVISMYHYPDSIENFKYTQLLVESNFLVLLQSLEHICRTWKQYMVVRSLMVEILISLCSNILGELDWTDIVTESMKTLPVQGSLSRLEPYSFQDPLSTTIIIYNYFLITTSECPEMSVDLFKDICTHVNLSKSSIPPPVFKAVWLCFAVGYLTHGETCYEAEKTNSTLILSLTAEYDLEKVFTHHPAILYWTFRSEHILKDVKTGVLNLWLKEDNEKSTNELKSLLAQSREAFTAYLEVFASQSMKEEVIKKHLSIFPDLLPRCNEQFIELVSYDAWCMLPQVLLQSCLRVESLGIVPLLVFCCEFQPELLDQDLLLKIACLVPGTICQQNSIRAPPSMDPLPTPDDTLNYIIAVKFIRVLFNKVGERNESMLLYTLLSHERFIITLEHSLTLKNDELTVIILELLSIILNLQRKHATISCRSVVLNGEDLVKLLYSSGGIAAATVKMLHSLMMADDVPFSSRVLVTIERPQDDLRTIYTRLHMICSLEVDELSSWCWNIIHRLLLYAQNCGLDRHLASLAFTHDLIRRCKPNTLAWSSMVEFLQVWLPCQPPVARNRSLRKVALDDTLLHLAQFELPL